MTADPKYVRPGGDGEATVRVTILGQEYPVRADADAHYVREIAAFLDARMRKIHEADPGRMPLRVAVLAGLNLADELFALRRELQDLEHRYERKIREFTDHLNRGLCD